MSYEMEKCTEGEIGSYAVSAIPSKDANMRLKKLMKGLRSKFGGPKFDPHLTIVGPLSLTREDALLKFKEACQGLKAYPAQAKAVSAGNSFWQTVYVLLEPTPQVVQISDHFDAHFGNDRSTPYMPHISLLYAHLTEEEKQEAVEEVKELDDTINTMSFTIDGLELDKLTLGDETLKSWVKVAEYKLDTLY